MVILQIEHAVVNYEAWKQSFDDDQLARKAAGVRSYRIARPVTDSRYVIVELVFDDRRSADRMLESLHNLWDHDQGRVVMHDPQSRLVETAEMHEY